MKWGVVAAIFVVAFLCAGVVSFVINYKSDQADDRAACVAAGGVPIWQQSRPYVCLDADAVIDVGGKR